MSREISAALSMLADEMHVSRSWIVSQLIRLASEGVLQKTMREALESNRPR